MASPENFEVDLVAQRSLSPSVRELVFERVDHQPMDHAPGQWLNLFVSVGESSEKRAYSIGSAASGSPRFELAVTRVPGGPVSEALHSLRDGARLRATGPNGLFTRAADEAAPAIFVATGTGVVPFRAMLQAAIAVRSTAPMWLLFGARHEEDILFREELDGWAREHDNIRVFVTLSQGDESWSGRRGYVQDHLATLHSALQAAVGHDAVHVYVCGLKHMVGAVRALARGELGIDRKLVHLERYD